MKIVFENLKIKIVVVVMLICPILSFSQEEGGLGILAGLNYASNGQLIDHTTNEREDASLNVGYHLGLFGKADFGRIYIRPEIKYTHTKSEYTKADLIIDKIDAPVLLGVDVHKHISVFAGPALQYIIDTDFSDFSIETANDDITVGLQFGLALNIEALGIDIRYERGLSSNEAAIGGLAQNSIDTRPDQFILGLSLNL